jgi:spermidine/putrescine transport system permease protein
MSEPQQRSRFWGSEAASGLALISPPALYAILLLAAPLATTLLYSFFTDGYLTIVPHLQLCNYIGECHSQMPDGTVSTETYLGAWTDPVVQTLLMRSMSVSIMVTATTVFLAYPVAYFLSFEVSPAKKSLWLFLITIPFWTSYVIRVFMWNVMIGRTGVINSALMETGIISEPLQMAYTIQAMVVTLAHSYAPFAILPIYVALEKIDRSLLEAGQDLGETRFTTFLRVTLPLSMTGVVAAVLIVFIPTIGDYVTPNLIGGGKIPMIANMIEKQMLKADNRPLGSAAAVSSMVAVVLVLFYAFVQSKLCAVLMKWVSERVTVRAAGVPWIAGAAVCLVAVVAQFLVFSALGEALGSPVLAIILAVVWHAALYLVLVGGKLRSVK